MATTPKKRTTRKPKYTVEQTAAYREEQRAKQADLMKEAVAQVLTSEGWRRWAKLRSKVNRYSFNNLCLIVSQRPDASMVMKYGDWKPFGRWVLPASEERGAPIQVFAPMFRWPTAEEIADGHPAEKKILYRFKLVPVFDVAQTDGDPLPDPPESQPITGDSHAHLLPLLTKLAGELGYTVEEKPASILHGAGGYCDYKNKTIALLDEQAPNAKVRTLIHEIAHALGVTYKDYGRAEAEVIVETTTWIVCEGLGLDTGGESIPYVAGWGEQDEAEAIVKFGAVVDKVARQIENAINTEQKVIA
jgi:hypothetical protein